MATKQSRYEGYVPVTKSGAVVMDRRKVTTADKARGAKTVFDLDKEGMRTSYETYKKKDDPDSKEISRRMGKVDEDAIRRVQQAGKESDYEYTREARRGKKLAKGGNVNSFRDGGIYTADMGEPPQDIDGGSAPPKKPTPKIIKPKGLSAKQSEAARNESKKELSEFKRRTPDKLTKFKKDDLILTGKDKASFRKGGSIDGIAQRGKTNCKMR